MFKILGYAQDIKSGAHVIYCQTTPINYLEIIGDKFEDFELQRKKEVHKGYTRLKNDIIEGALLPSITLAVKHESVENILGKLEEPEELRNLLSSTNGIVDILDGLQRTFILKEIKDSKTSFKDGQTLLLEYWLEPDIKNIVYRMIVLNSGQKAMSMRHQIDLLFATTKKTIENKVEGIELYTERDNKRRVSPNRYPLNHIAAAYYAFLKASPEQDSENIVNDQIKNNEIFESTKEKINEDFDNFIEILNKFKIIDDLSWKIYEKLDNSEEGTTWFGSDNVILSFFAAAGVFIKKDKKDKVMNSLDIIISQLHENIERKKYFDYFSIKDYQEIAKGINSRKYNIGSARRKYIFTMFKEFFRSEGEFDFDSCWESAAI